MSQDQQTYKRAATAACLGLFIQLGLALGMAMLGLYADSSAINSATCYLFGGLPVWLMLWIVYHQHQLERVETLEAEQLSREDAEAARLFDEAGQQLALARRRLENLYKYGLNGVSLVVGIYLLGVGVWLFISHYEAIQGAMAISGPLASFLSVFAAETTRQVSPLAVAAPAGVIAFIGFIVGRYVSGMTQEREWQLLRGGAAYLMGNVVMSSLVCLAALGAFFGSIVGYAILSLLIPLVMGLLGAEMLLAFVFGVYRPRRQGELTRAAFDSRILGWLSRPESIGKIVSETLNYQFGFEISRSWFYGLLSRAITPLALVGALVLLGASSLVIVGPQEQAVVTKFGHITRIAQPGLSFKWPWPVGGVQTFVTGRVQQIVVGSDTKPEVNGPVLWSDPHEKGKEQYLVVAPPRVQGQRLGVKTGAAELTGCRVVVKYRIDDLRSYVKSALEPEKALTMLAQRRLTEYLATHSIDSQLSGGREVGGPILRREIQADSNAYGLGLGIAFVGITEIHPPHEVAKAFHDQIGALQQKQSEIQKAIKKATTTLAEVAGSRDQAIAIDRAKQDLDTMVGQLGKLKTSSSAETAKTAALEKQIKQQSVKIQKLIEDAGGQAAEILAEARGDRWSHALSEAGKAERFSAQLEAYRKAPYYYAMRLYLDTLAQGIKNQRKIVITADQTAPPVIRFNLESQSSALESVLNGGSNNGD